jgi:hypothetical protein
MVRSKKFLPEMLRRRENEATGHKENIRQKSKLPQAINAPAAKGLRIMPDR